MTTKYEDQPVTLETSKITKLSVTYEGHANLQFPAPDGTMTITIPAPSPGLYRYTVTVTNDTVDTPAVDWLLG